MIDKYLNQYWFDSNLNHCYWNDMRSDRVFKFCFDTPIDIKKKFYIHFWNENDWNLKMF